MIYCGETAATANEEGSSINKKNWWGKKLHKGNLDGRKRSKKVIKMEQLKAYVEKDKQEVNISQHLRQC